MVMASVWKCVVFGFDTRIPIQAALEIEGGFLLGYKTRRLRALFFTVLDNTI